MDRQQAITAAAIIVPATSKATEKAPESLAQFIERITPKVLEKISRYFKKEPYNYELCQIGIFRSIDTQYQTLSQSNRTITDLPNWQDWLEKVVLGTCCIMTANLHASVTNQNATTHPLYKEGMELASTPIPA